MAKKSSGSSSHTTGLRDSLKQTKRADWMQADPELLRSAIAATARVGGALRLGYSRDGGAYAVGVYGDGDPYTLYLPPDEDIDTLLARVENAFSELG